VGKAKKGIEKGSSYNFIIYVIANEAYFYSLPNSFIDQFPMLLLLILLGILNKGGEKD